MKFLIAITVGLLSSFVVIKIRAKATKSIFLSDVGYGDIFTMVFLIMANISVLSILLELSQSIFQTILGLFCCVHAIVSALITFCTNPGYVKNNVCHGKPITDNHVLVDRCTDCGNECAFVAHDETVCVYKFDHTCAFVGNQIGALNKIWFIDFLTWQAMVGVSSTYIAVRRFITEYSGDFKKMVFEKGITRVSVLSYVAAFLGLGSFVSTFFVLVQQLVLLLCGHSVWTSENSAALRKALKKASVMIVEYQNRLVIVKADKVDKYLEGEIDYNRKRVRKLGLKQAIAAGNIGCYQKGLAGIKQAYVESQRIWRWKQ